MSCHSAESPTSLRSPPTIPTHNANNDNTPPLHRARALALPPPRPTSSSPGIRASALQKVYTDALSHTLRSCSYQNFAACFPTPAQYAPEALDGLHRDFVGKLDELCKAEFQALMDERDVVPSLNELDNLIADAKRRMERAKSEGPDGTTLTPPMPPHLLPPTALLAAHLSPFLSAQTDSLATQLEGVQGSNAQLAAEIASQRAEMEMLVRGLESFVADLEGAAGALGGEEMSGIEAEMRGGG